MFMTGVLCTVCGAQVYFTLTLKFDLLFENFNLGCYLVINGCRLASGVVF